MTDHLFASTDLRALLESRREQLKHEVQGFAGDYLLTVSEHDVQAYLLETYRMDAPILHADQATSGGTHDVQIDVTGDIRYGLFGRGPHFITGTMITIAIPFTGDGQLFQTRASTYTDSPPRGRVANGTIELTFQQLESNPDQLKAEYERAIKRVEELLQWVRNDVQAYNGVLPRVIAEVVRQRKEKLLKDRNLETALGIPLKRATTPASVPVVRRKPPVKPPASTGAFVPDPTLRDAEYDNILHIIENMVSVMERSPHAFATMDEESLRNHILVQLNGHYDGEATGETFNFTGKTDILIRANGKNAFVAECKFWSGPKGFLATIDQLLSYTSFRDTKTAVIIFNRNKDHTSVLTSITETLPTHALFKREGTKQEETQRRTVFRHPDDPQREIHVAVLAFHIPQPRPQS